MKIKQLLIAGALLSSAQAAIVYTSTYSPGNTGTILADGVVIATYTASGTGVFSDEDTPRWIPTIGTSTQDFNINITITNPNFSLVALTWSSDANDNNTVLGGGGSATVNISLDQAGTYTADSGQISGDWLVGGATVTGAASGTYTAGDILAADTNTTTTDTLWSISTTSLNSTLTYAAQSIPGATNNTSIFGESFKVNFSFVPEPSSAALLGLGGLALLGRRKRA